MYQRPFHMCDGLLMTNLHNFTLVVFIKYVFYSNTGPSGVYLCFGFEEITLAVDNKIVSRQMVRPHNGLFSIIWVWLFRFISH